MYLLVAASFLNVNFIAFDRLFAVSLHLRYQELVTPRRIAIQSVGICMDNKLRPRLPIFLFIFFPKESEMVAAVISLTGYILTTVVYVRI